MINEHWDYASVLGDMYEDDDDSIYRVYEVNAYNVVYAELKPLFAGE